MTNIDQFESVFRSADKQPFALEPFSFAHVLVVTDLSRELSEPFADEARLLLSEVAKEHQPDWEILGTEDYATVDDLVSRINDSGTDLICTYRNLKTPAR